MASPAQIDANFASFRIQNAHLTEILYRMTVANDALCDAHMPQTGMELQDKSQFSAALRDDAVRFFHLDRGPAILSIAPGSPADKAGLAIDDVILAINGEALGTDAPPAQDRSVKARVATINRITAQLDTALSKGTTLLSILRGTERLEIPLSGISGCRTKLDFTLSREMNSRADGLFVSIPSRLVEYTRDDDELAVILGHELSHNVQHDRDLFGTSGRIDRKQVSIRQSEAEADYVGVYLMARAGYDFHKAPLFWQRFGKDYGLGIFGDGTHPSWAKRVALTSQAVREIERKRARGLPLIPELPFFAGMSNAAG